MDVASWPEAADRFFTTDCRFWGEADIRGFWRAVHMLRSRFKSKAVAAARCSSNNRLKDKSSLHAGLEPPTTRLRAPYLSRKNHCLLHFCVRSVKNVHDSGLPLVGCCPSRHFVRRSDMSGFGEQADVLALARKDVNDPNVWSGRALQENFAELAVSGLASMYPASDWSVSCSGPPWISARVRSH